LAKIGKFVAVHVNAVLKISSPSFKPGHLFALEGFFSKCSARWCAEVAEFNANVYGFSK